MDGQSREELLAAIGHQASVLVQAHGKAPFERGYRAFRRRAAERQAKWHEWRGRCATLAEQYARQGCDRASGPKAHVWGLHLPVTELTQKETRPVWGWYPPNPCRGSLWHGPGLDESDLGARDFALLCVALWFANYPSPYREILNATLVEGGEEPLGEHDIDPLAMELLLATADGTDDVLTPAALEACVARVRMALEACRLESLKKAPGTQANDAAEVQNVFVAPPLKRCERAAWEAWQHAVDRSPELQEAKDDDLWRWVREHGGPDGYIPPSKDTFARHLRAARSAFGHGKYKRRGAPFPTRSVAEAGTV